ncbi:MAG: zinc-binding alcohol dehydrogenase family protein [Verrucomicrobiota bacterium]
MKTIRLEEPARLIALETEMPGEPGPGEALLRVHRIGVCGTDLHAYAGRQPFFSYPRILGHELGVEVLATGDGVSNVQAGDHCAVEPYLNCGKCIACRCGKSNCCADIRVLGVHCDGGMREQLLVPARKLHPSPTLSYDQLALVEPLAIGCHAVARAQLERNEYVLVIGAGPIGLAVMQFAVEAGAQVIVLDVNAARLEFCQRHLGVAHIINAASETVLDALLRLTGGELPTAVLDATGNAQSMAACFNYQAPGGRVVFVGLYQGEVSFNDPNFHKREMSLLASRNALPADFSRIIRLIEDGRIDTTPWISHRAEFSQVTEQFPRWTQPASGVIKAMIHF